MIKRIGFLVSVAALALPAVPAHAAALLFTLSGTSFGSPRNATFQLDSNPVPTSFSTSSLIGDQIQFTNVSGVFNGVAGVAESISFGNGLAAALNINSASLGFTQYAGPAIFSGSASEPVFAPGTFALGNPFFGSATLVVSEVSAAVPEPATWAMMIFGFGAVGSMLRYRRRSTTVSFG